MRGIFLVSCLLGGGALLTGCRDDGGPRPATEDAARIPGARASGGKAAPLCKNGNWNAPRDRHFPSPTTCLLQNWWEPRAKFIN